MERRTCRGCQGSKMLSIDFGGQQRREETRERCYQKNLHNIIGLSTFKLLWILEVSMTSRSWNEASSLYGY